MNIYIETDGGEVGLDKKNLTSVWCKHQVMHILFLASGSSHVIVIVLIAVITGLDLQRENDITIVCKRIGMRADVRSVESKEACFNICQEKGRNLSILSYKPRTGIVQKMLQPKGKSDFTCSFSISSEAFLYCLFSELPCLSQLLDVSWRDHPTVCWLDKEHRILLLIMGFLWSPIRPCRPKYQRKHMR